MKLTKEDKMLIEEAKNVTIKGRSTKLILTGQVGAVLMTTKGNIFRGVCTGFFCGMGSCAEDQAIGSMLSEGEKDIKKIVAVWYNRREKKYEILAPCGKCREMIHQLSRKCWDAEVIISRSKKVKLKELLPYPWDRTIEE